MEKNYEKGTFGYDLNYLSQKDGDLIVLSNDEGQSQIIVSAKYQAKVFTSTADGLDGKSLGFINYKFFDAGVVDEHVNGFGGENRFWLGPEGGQYSIFFKPGCEQTFDNWHTPAPIDVEAWNVTAIEDHCVMFDKEMEVTNYAGSALKVRLNRSVKLLDRSKFEDLLHNVGMEISPRIKAICYSTQNKITNLNDFEWTDKTGALCIWMLDMFNSAPRAVTIAPFIKGDEAKLGKIVTSDYFGEMPADRLKTIGQNVFMKTDGNYRSKLGLSEKRAQNIAGNYDPDAKRLTVIIYSVDSEAVYLSQEWNPAKDPLAGDAMNAYNDGPLDDGSIMGPFLELESASPAAFLKPGQSLSHIHSVIHLIGEAADLNPVAKDLFGITVDEIAAAFD